MSEDRIIALLTEIRDLQKQNTENYKAALQKQQEAVELQKQHLTEFQRKVVARQRMVVITVVVVTMIAFGIVTLTPALLKVH
jgi:hypothetical protein